MCACKSGNAEAVSALLERPDINLTLKDDQEMTCLMWSAMLGFREIVTLLLQVIKFQFGCFVRVFVREKR